LLFGAEQRFGVLLASYDAAAAAGPPPRSQSIHRNNS